MASINPLSSAQLPQVASPLTSTNTALPTTMADPSLAAQTGAPQLQSSLPMTAALASPYDGTTPTMGATGGMPTMGLPGGYGTPTTGGSTPQLNATNQTAIAPNGYVNQQVTNENTNKYYNIVVPNSMLGGWGGVGGLFGGNSAGNSFVDPQTGVLYVQRDTGITGWFKRLFRGY